MSNSLIYWYQDNTIYTSQETIDKVGYISLYFEYARRYSDIDNI
jgi:hypothetical protein